MSKHAHLVDPVIPQGLTRAQRKARRREIEARRRQLANDDGGETSAAALTQRFLADNGSVPKGGLRGTGSGRMWTPANVRAHLASSSQLAYAWPFLAEEGLGSRGPLIGREISSGTPFCFDPFVLYQAGVLTNPNIGIAGSVGSGKSALCKSLAIRGAAFGRKVLIPADPKGEWTAVVNALGGGTIVVGPGLSTRLNPLDPGPRNILDEHGRTLDDEAWARSTLTRQTDLLSTLVSTLLDRNLTPTEYSALTAALASGRSRHSELLLPHVVDSLFEPTDLPSGVTSLDELRMMGRDVGHTLARLLTGDLAGMFDAPSTVHFDPTATAFSIDVSHLGEASPALPIVMTCTSAWMETHIKASTDLRYMIYDEAWKAMSHTVLLARMRSQWKLSRGYGISNILVMHRITDMTAVGDEGSQSRGLAEGLFSDTDTRIVYRQPSDMIELTRKTLGLSHAAANILPTLPRGRGLWQLPGRTFLVDYHQTALEAPILDTEKRMK